jgi:hypothetical protein
MKRWLGKFGVLSLSILILSVSIWAKFKQDDKSLLDEAYESVKEAYGDFYIPSKMIDVDDLEGLYGVASNDVDAYIAESAMMTSHVDVFIGIKAKKGKGEAVSESLERYRLKLFDENGSDAAKMAKIEASKVFSFGDYVFFMVLGQNTDAVVSDETVFLDQAALEIERGKSALTKIFK